MKYIRTDADRILAYNEKVKDIDLPFILSQPGHIIKGPADTIEELCDEFVWNNRLLGNENVDFESKTTYVSKGGFIPFSDWEYKIYGAIWTDKGLIYVAKMNDKGELELI